MSRTQSLKQTDEMGFECEIDLAEVQRYWVPDRLGDFCDRLCNGYIHVIVIYKDATKAYRFTDNETRATFVQLLEDKLKAAITQTQD